LCTALCEAVCRIRDRPNRSESAEDCRHLGFTKHRQPDSLDSGLARQQGTERRRQLFSERLAGSRLERRHLIVEELRGRLDAGLEPEIHVRTEAVRRIGLGSSVRFVNEDDLGTVNPRGTSDGARNAAQSTELSNDQSAVDKVRERMNALGFAECIDPRALSRLLAQPFEVPKTLGSKYAIAGHATTALELEQRSGSARSEDAIYASRVKAKPAEFCL